MGSKRTSAGLILVPLFALVVMCSLAWACTPQGVISVTNSTVEGGGVQVVQGTGFAAKPVEIRWNSDDGPVVGVAEGPEFTLEVGVPATGEGFYYLVAVQPGADGHSAPLTAAATFEVTKGSGSSASQGRATDLWSGFGEAGSSSEGSLSRDNFSGRLSPWAAISGPSALLVALGAFSIAGIIILKGRRPSSSIRRR